MKRLLIDIIHEIDKNDGKDASELLNNIRRKVQSVLDFFYPQPRGGINDS